MNDNKNNKPVKNLGYYLGMAFGAVISLCLMALIVAITVRVIYMMF